MERKVVDSTSMLSWGYDPITKRMEVEYHNGKLYSFFGIPEELSRELDASPSKGGYMERNVKGVYSYEKLN